MTAYDDVTVDDARVAVDDTRVTVDGLRPYASPDGTLDAELVETGSLAIDVEPVGSLTIDVTVADTVP